MRYILLCLLLSPLENFAQQATGIHGTLIMMATGRDGIMIAVDSRFTLSKNNEIAGIVDGINKVYSLKGFVACYEGNNLLDSIQFVSATFKAYNELHTKKETFSKAVQGYIDYMKENYTKQLRTTLGDNIFIFAGYENKKPYIATWHPSDASTIFNETDSVFAYTHNKVKDYFGAYHPRESCRQLSQKAVAAMHKYVEEDKTFAAGKPFHAFMIKPNNILTNFNNFRGKHFFTTTTFEKVVQGGAIKVYLIKN